MSNIYLESATFMSPAVWNEAQRLRKDVCVSLVYVEDGEPRDLWVSSAIYVIIQNFYNLKTFKKNCKLACKCTIYSSIEGSSVTFEIRKSV